MGAAAGNHGKARQGLYQQILAGPVDVGPVGAKAGSRCKDDIGLDFPGVFVAKPKLVQYARPEVLCDHVRCRDQLLGNSHGLRFFEIERHAALVAVASQKQHTLTIDLLVCPAPFSLKRALQRLHGNHISAEVSKKLHPDRPHQKVIEAQNPNALEDIRHAFCLIFRFPGDATALSRRIF
ncbi:hypothetical protein GALL_457330 [mine drainage metagenome]|uniref:Uncharacterized protein n=1 Tax=mine drainage metagenome TaxID=410659 RepID=A0A1J5PPB6_9ZZZZ